mgnify:FL=1
MCELSIVHPSLRRYRWHLLRTAVERGEGGWWVRCSYAPLQRTTFNVFDFVGFVARVLLAFVWCHHQFEQISTDPTKGMHCGWCGKQAPTGTPNIDFIGRCSECGKLKLRLREWSWSTGPGGGHTGRFCDDCWDARPKDWEERMGITRQLAPGATFVRYVGEPRVTASGYGANAFGSVLAEYSDGSRIGVMCGHGGSAWLCLSCAQKMLVRS